jgi:hypothetical protein
VGEEFVIDFVCVLDVINGEVLVFCQLIQPYHCGIDEEAVNPSWFCYG